MHKLFLRIVEAVTAYRQKQTDTDSQKELAQDEEKLVVNEDIGPGADDTQRMFIANSHLKKNQVAIKPLISFDLVTPSPDLEKTVLQPEISTTTKQDVQVTKLNKDFETAAAKAQLDKQKAV